MTMLMTIIMPTGMAIIMARSWHHHEHAHAHDHHHHDHKRDHSQNHDHGDEASAWGHAHAPEPQELTGRHWLRRGLAAIIAVGLRPCSGAIIVLVFALAQGLFWIGVASTFLMGIGTAITVAAIATLAVGARGLAGRLAKAKPGAGMLLHPRIGNRGGAGHRVIRYRLAHRLHGERAVDGRVILLWPVMAAVASPATTIRKNPLPATQSARHAAYDHTHDPMHRGNGGEYLASSHPFPRPASRVC